MNQQMVHQQNHDRLHYPEQKSINNQGEATTKGSGHSLCWKNDMQNLFDTFKMQIKYDKDSLNSIVDLE